MNAPARKIDVLKREAAAKALELVESGMRIGLGTGSTAWHLVDLLGERVAKGFDILCVPTSEATAKQARGLHIPLTTLDEIDHLHMTIDGADEIGPGLSLIKGGGGALLREKIVAYTSDRMIVIADETKIVEQLGKFDLPIEVNLFGLTSTMRSLSGLGHLFGHNVDPASFLSIREKSAGEQFITDGGHLIVDASFGRISDPEGLSRALLDIPGVVQHGLFLGMSDLAYVATSDGVKTLEL